MKKAFPLVAAILLSLPICGCAAPSARSLVPWWIGWPACVLSPSSQEAYAWRMRHERRGPAMCEPAPPADVHEQPADQAASDSDVFFSP